jgi:hypothetical protein
MSKKSLILISMVLLLSACSEPAPPQPTQVIETIIAPTETEVPPTETEVPPTETEIIPTETEAPIYTVPLFSCPGAVRTRMALGIVARVTYSEGPGLNIRTTPFFTDSNIRGLVAEGNFVDILDGPECVTNSPDGVVYVFWRIRDRQTEVQGWVAEGEPGNYFLEYTLPPRQLRSDEQLAAAYESAWEVMGDPELIDSEKRAQLRVVQRTYGEDILATVIEYIPVYDSNLNWFSNFDAYVRHLISPYGNWSSDSPFEDDPIGAGLSIFFDPSAENIAEMLGLD